ncbi:hypothetical protein M427DRAFT_152408 [Gonapodya prolifera JEL478]|uniref:Uncharacterized protein n=1 Tax=Gonapodya prolifera (strain JEL478) TaxID=1344416 RepID=A0A139ARP1_GONPJ|nr:hypothetical protein M427DRAFT_152408 [Gonapodya prolifera JEL478]|eukprot:KXS19379.1 hypothetical protein M427DRAFT_152408 [Gonapodya prolifera JEL478]
MHASRSSRAMDLPTVLPSPLASLPSLLPPDLSLFLLSDNSVSAVPSSLPSPSSLSHSSALPPTSLVHLSPSAASAIALQPLNPLAQLRFSTRNVLSTHRDAVTHALVFRNAFVPDAAVYVPASGGMVEEDVLATCEQTNMPISSISWPPTPAAANPHISQLPDGAVRLTSLDRRASITLYPHAHVFWASFPAPVHDPDGFVDEIKVRRLAASLNVGAMVGPGVSVASDLDRANQSANRASTHAYAPSRRASAPGTARVSPVRKSVSFSDALAWADRDDVRGESGLVDRDYGVVGDEANYRPDRIDSAISLGGAKPPLRTRPATALSTTTSPGQTSMPTEYIVGRRRFRHAYLPFTQGPFSARDPPEAWAAPVMMLLTYLEGELKGVYAALLPDTPPSPYAPSHPVAIHTRIVDPTHTSALSHSLNATYVPPTISLRPPRGLPVSAFLNATHPPAPSRPTPPLGFPDRRIAAMACDRAVYLCVAVEERDEVVAVVTGAGVVVTTTEGGRYASTTPLVLPPDANVKSLTDMYRTHAVPSRGWNRVTGVSFPLSTVISTCHKILLHNASHPAPPRPRIATPPPGTGPLSPLPPLSLPSPSTPTRSSRAGTPPVSMPRHTALPAMPTTPPSTPDRRRSLTTASTPAPTPTSASSLSSCSSSAPFIAVPPAPLFGARRSDEPPPRTSGKAADVVRGVGSLVGRSDVAEVLAERVRRNREVLERMRG